MGTSGERFGPDLVVVNRGGPIFNDIRSFMEAKVPGNCVGKVVYLVLQEHRRKNPLTISVKDVGQWMSVKVSVNAARFPLQMDFPVRTSPIGDRVAQILMGQKFSYETEKVAFNSIGEAMAFGAGNGMFWVLRKLKRVEGRLARTTRNIQGIRWMEEYRKWIASGMKDVTPEVLIEKKRRARRPKIEQVNNGQGGV